MYFHSTESHNIPYVKQITQIGLRRPTKKISFPIPN